MLTVDHYGDIRRAYRDGMSIRDIARTFHHSRYKVRRILATPATREGWALYCESLMAEEGFLEPPQRFFQAHHLLWRALRIIIENPADPDRTHQSGEGIGLQNARGRNHRIHLCRNDGQPQGVVYTRRFDLLVMNGGAGEMPTEEGLAQAVAAVAHAVAANEAAEPVEQLASALLPQSERVARYSAGQQLR
jgi:hypothetical protein